MPYCTGFSASGCHLPAAGYATIDLDHARYTSPYIALVNHDVIDDRLHVRTDLSTTERQLLQRNVLSYVTSPTTRWDDLIWHAAFEPGENHGMPLISIGGYLRVDYGAAVPGDLTPTLSATPLSPAVVQQSLVRGKPVGGAPYSLVHDVNVDTNVLTALICHADGMRPKSVCTRKAPHTIVRAIK